MTSRRAIVWIVPLTLFALTLLSHSQLFSWQTLTHIASPAPSTHLSGIIPIALVVLAREHRGERGQGLAEYALTIALVALVVIVAAFAIGLAVQRVYGVVAGALGVKHDTHGTHTLVIESANCFASTSANQTGLWVTGTTDENFSDLTGSTEQAVGTGVNGQSYPIEPNAGGFLWRPLLATNKADTSLCPTSVVIQAKDGAIAVSPLTTASLPWMSKRLKKRGHFGKK